ncbi:MAG: hypothetical protein NVSMB60_07650 [Mycobacterium sp.]
MRLQQARPAVAHQQRLENAVAAHRSQVIGDKQRRRRVVEFTIERDDDASNTGNARHGKEA